MSNRSQGAVVRVQKNQLSHRSQALPGNAFLEAPPRFSHADRNDPSKLLFYSRPLFTPWNSEGQFTRLNSRSDSIAYLTQA